MASTSLATRRGSRRRVHPVLWAALALAVVAGVGYSVVYPARQAARRAARTRELRAELLADVTAPERLAEVRAASSASRDSAVGWNPDPLFDSAQGAGAGGGFGFGGGFGTPPGSRQFVRAGSEGGPEAVQAELSERETSLALLDFALDEAVLSLAPTSVASGYHSRDEIAGRAYAAASVADAVTALPMAGYFAEPIAVVRLSALTMVRGAHDESAAASELARALDSMLLEQNRLWSDLTGVARSPDVDPVLAELMADPEESVRIAAECRALDADAARKLELIQACEPVAERIRQALLNAGHPDPRGALGRRATAGPGAGFEIESAESARR